MKTTTFKSILIALLLLVMGVCLSSCHKYPNDEHRSLHSINSRLCHTWTLVSITNISFNNPYYPSQPNPSPNYSYTESFSKDNTYSCSTNSNHCTWSIGSKETIVFNMPAAAESTVKMYQIIKLTNDEFWYIAKGSNQLQMECHLKR